MYTFRIVNAASEQYRVRFLYNSEIMVWSENFTSKTAASNNVSSIKRNAPDSRIVDLSIGQSGSGYRWEILKAANNEYFTRFKAPNGEIMVRSETYPDKRNAVNCAASVSRNAASAALIDEAVSKVA